MCDNNNKAKHDNSGVTKFWPLTRICCIGPLVMVCYVMLCYSYCSPTLTVINSHECANGLILCALQ